MRWDVRQIGARKARTIGNKVALKTSTKGVILVGKGGALIGARELTF
jgi:hypothetical protein